MSATAAKKQKPLKRHPSKLKKMSAYTILAIILIRDVYKRQDLQRVAQSRLPDGALVAFFIVVLLVAVHLGGMAGVAAPQPLGRCV